METAGNEVDDDELRAAMKANGIGRPSTRAAIIELLFKRGYIAHQKKNIIPTSIGQTLIASITDPLLKSPELTGQWEKKLRDVESGKYPVKQFMEELKDMTYQIVHKQRA
jgi:DNA topoisomerase-3